MIAAVVGEDQRYNNCIVERISRYKIIRKIASGGMGDVYEALDPELDRKVALKVLPVEIAKDPGRLQRFLREARAASSLNHPSVIQIHEIAQDGDIHFISMEYIDGETLEKRLSRGPCSVKETVQLALKIADALQAAHANGIVHRDIKPSNIMLTSSTQIKILDFGLAKVQPVVAEPVRPSEVQTRTSSGMILGTPHYMSPEQTLGKDLDQRTDIFSFGVMLYEMLSGKRPFSGDDFKAVLGQILYREPEPLHLLREDLPADLQKIISQCMAKEVGERYQSMSDVIHDLQRVQDQSSGISTESIYVVRGPEYFLRRTPARILFVVLQCVYIAMYIAALRWPLAMQSSLEHMLGSGVGMIVTWILLIIAPIGIAVRLYLISSVLLDHVRTGVRYRQAFPFFFLIDAIWAISPLGLSLKWGELLTFAFIAPLAFSPFSQRTLIRSAYDLYVSRRVLTQPPVS
ncbi:MAG TPA: serine/threonine-protein kinase [Acidobacteriota bacterium]|nr:serine/threonine-protein kinase [Acidobacteriota bacterium]